MKEQQGKEDHVNGKLFLDNLSQFEELQKEYEKTVEQFYVEAWDRWIYVREPSALERSIFEGGFVGDKRPDAVKHMKIDTCYLIMCTAEGKPLFSNLQQARKILVTQNGNAITQIANKAEKLMKITKEDIEAATENL